jgi:glycerol-3-phosphate acyltransferase PlsY
MLDLLIGLTPFILFILAFTSLLTLFLSRLSSIDRMLVYTTVLLTMLFNY